MQAEQCFSDWVIFKEKISTHYLFENRAVNSYDFGTEALDPRNERLWRGSDSYPFLCLKSLFGKILALPASSADAERGFSIQNLIKTETRNRLTLETLTAIMRVKLNGG